MGNSYAERVQRDRQRYLDIGLDSGAQIVHDMLCVALRDKQAMETTYGARSASCVC